MGIQVAPGWWKAVSQLDGNWDITEFDKRKLAVVTIGEDSEIHTLMMYCSAYTAELLASVPKLYEKWKYT